MSAVPAIPEPRFVPRFVEYEGYLVSEDGEIIGVVLPSGDYELYPVTVTSAVTGESEIIAPKTPWVPKTESDGLWLMEKRSNLRAKIERLKIQEADVIERMQVQKRRAESDLERFDRRFEVDLFAIAGDIVKNQKKGKSWLTPYGSVSFTDSLAKIKNATASPEELSGQEFIDANKDLELKRLAWAKEFCPESIDVPPQPEPRFLISLVPKEIKDQLISLAKANPERARNNGFEFVPAGQTVKVNQ